MASTGPRVYLFLTGSEKALRPHLTAIGILAVIILTIASGVNAQARISQNQLMEAERLLQGLGFWTVVGDEEFDVTARFALGAFQRWRGSKLTGKLTLRDLKLLRSSKKMKLKSTSGFRVEVNTAKRILYWVEPDGSVSHIVPVAIGSDRVFTSSGKKQTAHTPRGSFSIKRQLQGWKASSFGELYYPNYFQGGLAIHGSQKMTLNSYTYGCIAVPMFAAELLSRVLKIGTRVVIN